MSTFTLFSVPTPIPTHQHPGALPPRRFNGQPAGSQPEDKLLPQPKGNPWTKKLPQHLSPVGTGVPPPAQDSLEAGERGPREVFGF